MVDIKLLDDAIQLWSDMHEKLHDGRDQIHNSLISDTSSEQDREWVSQYLDGRTLMLSSTLAMFEGVKKAALDLDDISGAEVAAQFSGLIGLQCYQLMQERHFGSQPKVDRHSTALKRCEEIADKLIRNLKGACETAIKVAEAQSRVMKSSFSVPNIDIPEVNEDQPLPEDLIRNAELRHHAQDLKILQGILEKVNSVGPAVTRESMRLIEACTTPYLEEAVRGDYKEIIRKYKAYRLLAEYGPGMVAVGAETLSAIPGLASAIGLLASFIAKKAICEPLGEREDEALLKAQYLSLDLLPSFLLPYCGCMVSHILISSSRMKANTVTVL